MVFSHLQEIGTAFVQSIQTITNGNDFTTGMIVVMIVSSVVMLFRNTFSSVRNFITKQLTTKLQINSQQKAYYKVLELFESQEVSTNGRTISVLDPQRRNEFGDRKTKTAVKGLGDGPSYPILFNTRVKIEISEQSSGAAIFQSMVITKLGRSHAIFDRLIHEINKKNKDGIKRTTIFDISQYGAEFKSEQIAHSLDHVILKTNIKSELVEFIKKWEDKEKWHIEKGIPYTLTILLYGPPGTGKSSLIRAIAAHMDRDLIETENVQDVIYACAQASDTQIISVDDLDTIISAKRDLDDDDDDEEDKKPKQKSESGLDKMVSSIENGNLGRLLNAMDGVNTSHGRVMIMGTNDINSLDAALVRPGRVHLKLKIDYLNEEMFFTFLDKFDIEYTDEDVRQFIIKPKMCPAEVQSDVMLEFNKEQLIKKYGRR